MDGRWWKRYKRLRGVGLADVHSRVISFTCFKLHLIRGITSSYLVQHLIHAVNMSVK